MKNVHEIEIKLDKEWIDALDATFKKKNKEVKIDGFRKGMASKDIYLKHFGIESLYADAVDTCIGVAYKKALEDNKLVPACEPSVDVTGISDSNVIFKFKIITKPEVTLGEYKNLKIKKEKVKVTDEEIDNQIEHMRGHMADIVVKDNEEIVNGDTAVINFEGKVDGKVVDGATGENYPLEIGSHSFIPGFEEGLVGLKKGDVKELNLKFPENYVEDLKGKDVVFTVTVNEIKTKVLPEINEDFFKDLGYEDVKTLDELKNKVKEELTHEKEHQEEEKFMDQVLETAVKNMKIELNEEIVDEEIHRMINQYAEQLKMYGMDINEYFKMTGMNEETLHAQMKPEAEKRVKYRYLLEAVAEKEDIKFTEKEIEKGAENLATKYGITKEQLIESFGSMDVVEYDMKMQKAIEILKENN